MTHPRSLSGRHALVCGASAGLGRACALALAKEGASVTVLARRAHLLEALVPELEEAGAPWARYVAADHGHREDLLARVQETVDEVGAVHVLVNNTGGPPAGPILEADEAAFLDAFGRHLLANHRLVQLLLPGMVEAGYGRIINIVSTSVREPLPGLGVSNTTRAAVAGWAKTLAHELPSGVTINNVLPGFTDTERLDVLAQRMADAGGSPEEVRRGWLALIPEGRLGRPEELAATVAFLAGPQAAYIRGQSLAVDGGRMRSI